MRASSVNVLVAEYDGSAYYRLIEPARALADAGYDVAVYDLSTSGQDVRDADTYVVNRPIRPEQSALVKRLRHLGKRVVVDIDDDFHHLVPEHTMYGRFDLDPLLAACEAASVVTLSTPNLDTTYGFGHGAVVRNMVPERYLSSVRPEEHDGIWVGWYGTVASHPNDLLASNGGIGRGIKRAGADLCLLGNPKEKDRICQQLGIFPGTPLHVSGFCRVHKMAEHLTQYDIGLVPLQGCHFNESKSWLKGLELAACGVPFVATPTSEYALLRDLGAGLVADTKNAWSRHIQELAKDTDYRASVSADGRRAAAGLTIEGNVDQWAATWCADTSTSVQRETIESYRELEVSA